MPKNRGGGAKSANNRPGTIIGVVSIVLAVLVIAAVLWWTQAFNSPERAYRDMLANNLTTTSVTKSELSTKGNQSVLQHVTLNLGAVNAARWLVTMKNGDATVTTESIGTPEQGFVRYLEITGSKKDYGKVVGVWSKGSAKDDDALGALFSQAVLDVGSAPVPPIGNPSPYVRGKILDYIKNQAVFTPDFNSVKSEVINGRQVYSMTVSVKLAPYLKIMQTFADVYGIDSLDGINPNDYQSLQPVKLTVSIDKLAHTMARVSYQPSSFVETFSDYGLKNNVRLPSATISSAELQKRLQSVQ